MQIPTREVGVQPFTPGEDDHGAPIDAWGPAVGVAVYGWAPASMAQPIEGNRRPVEVDIEVYAPPGTVTRPRDVWLLPEGHLEQVGHPEDYGNGPWWSDAGVRIQLRRVEG